MKDIYKYALIFTLIFLIAGLVSLAFYDNYEEEKDKYKLLVLQNDDYWYYEIKHNNQLFIRQEYIPVISGKNRFTTEVDARLIGNLAMQKLNNNQLPIISIEDIITNKIQYIKD